MAIPTSLSCKHARLCCFSTFLFPGEPSPGWTRSLARSSSGPELLHVAGESPTDTRGRSSHEEEHSAGRAQGSAETTVSLWS